jgi:hypothetical protein
MPKITIEQQAEAIARWKAVNGVEGRDYVPVNNGKRRTPSKRALLKTIADGIRQDGKRPKFEANS